MKFSIALGRPETIHCDAIAVGISEESGKQTLTGAAKSLDQATHGFISKILKNGDFSAKSGTALMLPAPDGGQAQRIILVGLGKQKSFSEQEFRAAIIAAMRTLSECGAKKAVFAFWDTPLHNVHWRILQATRLILESAYRFDRYKSKKFQVSALASKEIQFLLTSEKDKVATRLALTEGKAMSNGANFARDLANTPPNICTPSYLASQAKNLARSHGLQLEVLNSNDMKKLGMNALLAVAQGSNESPKFIILKHNGGKKNDKPVVLVGKGITFDTGGISLKPPSDMDEMKFDMCGAASVIGTLCAASELNIPLNVIGVVPTAENMPDGKAARPGDIVTSLSGKTVEILNTDAEGRLILCDALSYVERFSPQCVIDIATLTGACIIALGHVVSGMLTPDDKLAAELTSAGEESWDRVWRLPLLKDYQELLHSNFADMANIGGRSAGTITAACFLARFTEKYSWAHLDIAGTAFRSGKEKGATGRPVYLLTQFLLARAKG